MFDSPSYTTHLYVVLRDGSQTEYAQVRYFSHSFGPKLPHEVGWV